MTEDEQRIQQVLRNAAALVDTADLPADLRPTAFSKAVDLLEGLLTRGPRPPAARSLDEPSGATLPSENDFFAVLANESGVSETDLRDILRLTHDGDVHVMTPTKDLGTSVAEQAKTVIALVAGARAKGLAENPIRTDAVRKEVERKHCYQSNNFATAHLGKLRGFNNGGRNDLLLTSKWVDDFRAAIARAHGRKSDEA